MSLAQFILILFTFSVYQVMLGWKVALLLVFGVGFHEMCHLQMAKRQGIPTGGFYMIPFLGGIALVKGAYKTLWQQSLVVLAGPLGGGLSAIALAGVYALTGNQAIGISSVLLLVFNAFNLLPFSFLDGGQLAETVAYSFGRKIGFGFKVVSTLVALVCLIKMNPIIACMVGVVGGNDIANEFRNLENLKKNRRWLVPDNFLYPPKKLTTKQLVLTIVGHIGTAVLLLGVAMIVMHSIVNLHLDEALDKLKK